jgi:hypothetical protein
MEFKLNEKAEALKKALEENDGYLPEDHELEGFQSEMSASDGFWYNLTAGGYFKPEHILADEEQIKKVNEAKELMMALEEVYTELAIKF